MRITEICIYRMSGQTINSNNCASEFNPLSNIEIFFTICIRHKEVSTQFVCNPFLCLSDESSRTHTSSYMILL